MHRFSSWVVHASLSLIVLCAISDSIPPSQRGPKDKYNVAVACISLILSTFITASHLVGNLRVMLIGGVVELVTSAILLAMWLIAIMLIQNPKNEIATFVNGAGFEQIQYANLYFFGWIVFFWNVYLVGSIFRDNNSFDPKLLSWLLLFATSLILLGTSGNLREDICDLSEGRTCTRTDFAIAIGAINTFLSSLALMVVTCLKLNPLSELLISFFVAGFYFFGVVILTSASGPASTLGTLYFATWTGAAFSYWTCLSAFNEIFYKDLGGSDEAAPALKQTTTMTPAAALEHSMKSNIDPGAKEDDDV